MLQRAAVHGVHHLVASPWLKRFALLCRGELAQYLRAVPHSREQACTGAEQRLYLWNASTYLESLVCCAEGVCVVPAGRLPRGGFPAQVHSDWAVLGGDSAAPVQQCAA